MKINWKVRFKNKIWLASFIGAILSFAYTMLGLFDVYPEVTEADAGKLVSSMLMFLSLVGVINDPTTDGLGDSERALSYETPWIDVLPDGTEEHIISADPEEGTYVLENSEPKSEEETGT